MQTNPNKIYYFIVSILLGYVVTFTALLVLPIIIYKLPTVGIYLFMLILGVIVFIYNGVVFTVVSFVEDLLSSRKKGDRGIK